MTRISNERAEGIAADLKLWHRAELTSDEFKAVDRQLRSCAVTTIDNLMSDRADDKAEIDRLTAELRRIDAVMARRPALDKSSRAENIEHAINTAGRADEAERRHEADKARIASLEAERDGLMVEVERLKESEHQYARSNFMHQENYAELEAERDELRKRVESLDNLLKALLIDRPSYALEKEREE